MISILGASVTKVVSSMLADVLLAFIGASLNLSDTRSIDTFLVVLSGLAGLVELAASLVGLSGLDTVDGLDILEGLAGLDTVEGLAGLAGLDTLGETT